MSLRVMLSCVLLGCISAAVGFFSWSTFRSLEGSTYGLEGEITRVTLEPSSNSSLSTLQEQEAIEDMQEFLDASSLTFVGESYGDGYPELIFFDGSGALGWSTPDLGMRTGNPIFVFEGTYSANRFVETGMVPYSPAESYVAGILEPVKDLGNIQYARANVSGELIRGDYVLQTSGDLDREEFFDRVRSQGFDIDDIRKTSPLEELITNPSVVLSLLLLGSSGAALSMYWLLFFRSEQTDLEIRRMYGATPAMLARNMITDVATSVLLGTVTGAAIFHGSLVSVAKSSEYHPPLIALFGGLVLGILVAFACLAASALFMSYVGLRSTSSGS